MVDKISKDKGNEKPIDFKYNLSLYWKFVRKYKLSIFLILFITLFFQIMHVAERFLFKIITDDGASFISNNLQREVFVSRLITIGLIFLVMVFLQTIVRWIWLGIINKFETTTMLDLKKEMFNHVVHLDHEFHTSNKTGSLISKLLRGGYAMERLSDVFFFNFSPLLIQAIVISASIMMFDITSAIVTLLTVFSFILFSAVINKKQQKPNMDANDAEDEEKAVISNYLTNIESVKYFGKELNVKKNYLGFANLTKNATLRHWNYFRLLSAGHTFILGLGIFFLVYFPLQKLLLNEIGIGTIIFIYTSFGSMVGHLFGFDHGLRGFYRSMADFESLFKYYKQQKTVLDLPSAKKIKINRGEIEFKNVYFKYKNRYVINGFNFKISPKTKVALVGSSGSGKTTLVKLLYRLYDASEGEILIDGVNIKDVKQESLRSELSIVPQEAILFDDTLYNNIIFSKPGATRSEVLDAMKFAQLDKVVAEFPLKEKTIVGERGIKLSGGEKQRVGIARAILANKKIMVLDEATSALDSETEYEIQKDLEKLMSGRTSIVIAHRLSTIMKADVIIVMDKGKIVQVGKHRELMLQKGIYRKLWTLQKGGYIK